MKWSTAHVIAAFWAGITLLPSALAKPAVIVHPDCHAQATVEKVRRIFLGKERSLCGESVAQPLDVDEHNPLRPFFLEKILEKDSSQLRQYWSRLIFTGKGAPPKNVGADDEVKAFVSRHKDAIGVIDSAHVDKSVKVLLMLE